MLFTLTHNNNNKDETVLNTETLLTAFQSWSTEKRLLVDGHHMVNSSTYKSQGGSPASSHVPVFSHSPQSHSLSLSCILSLLTKLRLLCSASIWVVSWTVQSVFTTTKKNRMSNAQLIHIQSGRNIENRLVFISSLTGCVENWSTKKLNKSSCSGVLHTYKVLTPKACAGG